VQVRYQYNTIIQFNQTIEKHFFTLFDIISNGCQILENSRCVIHGSKEVSSYQDSYGNQVIYGKILDSHEFFNVSYSGVAELKPYYLFEEEDRRYLMSYLATQGGIECDKLFYRIEKCINESDFSIQKVVIESMRVIHTWCIYEKNVTTQKTTAEEFCKYRKGVCQDYANLLIVLLRKFFIPARYVAGIMVGEGETHAWVEVFDGKGWFGADPTHQTIIDTGYIKICHGRDSMECTLNRGVFHGSASQILSVEVCVEQ